MKIRNPQGYEKAERKRRQRHDELVGKIAKRLGPIVREKFDGGLIVDNLYEAYVLLAQDGGIKPEEGRPSRLNKRRNERQDLMREALNLAIEMDELTMTDDTDGEIVLSVPMPKVTIDPTAERQERLDYYEENFASLTRTPICTLRQWGVV